MVTKSPRQYRCDLIEGVEKVSGYQTGGFCPINVGQILDDKYKITAKLGCGGFSTVWLAEDISAISCNHWVALKILKSEKSSIDNSELKILRSVRHTNIIQYLDNFWIQSPNGHHLCFVIEVTGPAVKEYIEPMWYGNSDSNTAIDLTRQCIIALKTLHELGYAHGDVCLANFVLGLSDISGLTKESMHNHLGDPETGIVSSRDGSPLPASIPQQLFMPVSLRDLADISSVKMVDFGEAFYGWKKDVATHVTYRAPELLAEKGATIKSDIWSMGCLISELMTSHALFSGNFTTVARQQALFFAKTHDEQYKYLQHFLSEHSILEYEEENDLLAALLVHMLVQDPQGRVSLEQLLEHEFFKLAGHIPQSAALIGKVSVTESTQPQKSTAINSTHQLTSVGIGSSLLGNGEAENPSPISNMLRSGSGRWAFRSSTLQASQRSRSKRPDKDVGPANASLGPVQASKVSKVARKKKSRSRRRLAVIPKMASGSSI